MILKDSEIITISGRKTEISRSLRHIGYEKDNLVETRTFCIKNKELFGMEFFIDLENTLESNLLEKTFSSDGNEMLLTWNISSGCLKKPGVITFQLRGVDAEGEKVWHSTKDYFLSGNSIDTYSDVTEDEANSFIQLEKNVVSLKNETQALSDSARESSLTAKEYSENASALCDELREDYNGFKEQLYTKDEVDEKLENKSNKQTVTAHTENHENPHGVTAEQVGAYTKAQVDDKINHHDHPFAGGYSTEGISSFEIEGIIGDYDSFKNSIITTTGSTTLGFISMDCTSAQATFKLLSGSATVYYGADMVDLISGSLFFEVQSKAMTVGESLSVNSKGSITSLMDLGGADYTEDCLFIIEAVDAEIEVEYYRKAMYSHGFMTGEDKEKLDNLEENVGSIDTALDELHAYAQALIGGEA